MAALKIAPKGAKKRTDAAKAKNTGAAPKDGKKAKKKKADEKKEKPAGGDGGGGDGGGGTGGRVFK